MAPSLCLSRRDAGAPGSAQAPETAHAATRCAVDAWPANQPPGPLARDRQHERVPDPSAGGRGAVDRALLDDDAWRWPWCRPPSRLRPPPWPGARPSRVSARSCVACFGLRGRTSSASHGSRMACPLAAWSPAPGHRPGRGLAPPARRAAPPLARGPVLQRRSSASAPILRATRLWPAERHNTGRARP